MSSAATENSVRVACLYFKKGAALLPLAEACYAYTPQLALRPHNAIFLHVAASRQLFSTDELAAELKNLCETFGQAPHLAFGSNPQQALALARFPGLSLPELPLAALSAFLSPFTDDAALEARGETINQLLRQLGLKTLSDLLALSREKLAGRLGAEAGIILRGLRGEDFLPWPRWQPPASTTEMYEVDPFENFLGGDHLATLMFVLKNLSDRILLRLRPRGQSLSALKLSLEFEDRSQRDWLLRLPIPQSSTRALLPILQERLSYDLQRQPLTGSITRLQLTATEMVRGHSPQRQFFTRDTAEDWETLLGRLTGKLGCERVFFANPIARYLPEKAWQKSLQRADLRAPLDLPRRPTRLLPEPRRLGRPGYDAFLSDARWTGPERLQSEWWLDAGLHGFFRDYYEVETLNGEKLWIFTNERGEIFLHGYFD